MMMKRHLNRWEQEEANLVFGSNLDYDQVWIYEQVAWPDWLGRLGAILRRRKPGGHNAVTLGNRIFFPTLVESNHPTPHIRINQTAWLIHELTHVWQYQREGWRYLFQALGVILRHGHWAYQVGSEDTLIKARLAGARFKDYNREQQGELTRGYYVRLKQGKNVEAWKGYITEIQDLS
jgi:hypothetical protein